MSLLLLAGCGTKDDGHENDVKTFRQDDNKEVKIPENPKRIVVLHPTYIGAFVKFGHTPVGVTDFINQNKTLKEAAKSSKVITAHDIEAITKLKPDLIITTKEDKNYKKLKKISATIQMDAMKSDYKQTTKKMAYIVNEEDKADKWLEKWEKTLKNDRDKLGDKINGKSITVVQSTPKGITAFGKNYGRGMKLFMMVMA